MKAPRHLGRGFFFAPRRSTLFRLLSPLVRLRYVLSCGTYLAQRWEEDGGVNLCHLADGGRGFFVEIGP